MQVQEEYYGTDILQQSLKGSDPSFSIPCYHLRITFEMFPVLTFYELCGSGIIIIILHFHVKSCAALALRNSGSICHCHILCPPVKMFQNMIKMKLKKTKRSVACFNHKSSGHHWATPHLDPNQNYFYT